MTKSKNKLKLQQRINDYILSTYGEHVPGKPGLVLTESGDEFDLYREITRIFYQAENTRGNRKGNRDSFAKKNMQYFPRDFQHAEDKFESLQDNLDITVSEKPLLDNVYIASTSAFYCFKRRDSEIFWKC